MPYTPGIPTAVQFISASQPLIQQNFTELQTWASVDHSPLASAVGLEGYHYKTTWVPQGPPLTGAINFAGPLFPVGYPGFFAANPANVVGTYPNTPLTGNVELYYANSANPAVINPISAQKYVQLYPAPTEGFFYTSGGTLVRYGTYIFAPAALQQYAFIINAALPTFDAAFAPALVTQLIGGGAPAIINVTNATNLLFQFTSTGLNNAPVAGAIFWYAIGKPA